MKTEEKHKHSWIFAGYDQNRCLCGALQISEAEEDKRNEEWRAFDAMVRETESYKEWFEMRTAFRAKPRDMATIHEIVKKADKRLEENNYLPHPKFPDPATFPYVLKETI